MKICVTLPTRGSHPQLLNNLVKDCGISPEDIIIVRTAPTELPPDVQVIDDHGEINIHRWWNKGIMEAATRGADYVAVLNDDLEVGSEAVKQLAHFAQATGAVIATPGESLKVHRNRFPLNRIVVGSIWLLKVDSDLRPDESFNWWFGDDDLDIRARRSRHGIVTVPVDYTHMHASQATDTSPVLQSLIDKDHSTFKKKHYLTSLWRDADRKSGGRLSRSRATED